MATWSAEAGLLADLIEAVRGLETTLIAVNMTKGEPPKPKPYPRPNSAVRDIMDRARTERRIAKHNALVARVLPARSRPPS